MMDIKLKIGLSLLLVIGIIVICGWWILNNQPQTPPPTQNLKGNEVLIRVYVKTDQPSDNVHEPLSGTPQEVGVYKYYHKTCPSCPGCGTFVKIDSIALKRLNSSTFYGEKIVKGINTITTGHYCKHIRFCVGYVTTNFIDEDTCVEINQSKKEWDLNIHYWKTMIGIGID